MSLQEFVAKSAAVVLAAGALIGTGFLVLLGPHPYNDYLNLIIVGILFLLGALALGWGGMVQLRIFMVERAERREHQVHVTPRQGEPGLPPAWGMGDVGKPGGAAS